MNCAKFGKKLLLPLFLVVPLTAYSQENVAALWSSVNVKKNLGKGFALTLRGEYRAKDNFQANDLYFVRLTGSYKICNYLSTAIAYDYFSSQQDASTKGELNVTPWAKHSHRLLFDFAGNYTYKVINFSLRERYVYSYNISQSVPASDENGLFCEYETPGGSAHLLRSLPTVTYKIPNSRFSPYIAAEFFNSLNSGDNFKLQQYHLFAGTSIKLDKVNSLKVFYVLQTKLPSNKHLHTLGIDYIITLP